MPRACHRCTGHLCGGVQVQVQGMHRHQAVHVLVSPVHCLRKIDAPIPKRGGRGAHACPGFLLEQAREHVLVRQVEGHELAQAAVHDGMDPVGGLCQKSVRRGVSGDGPTFPCIFFGGGGGGRTFLDEYSDASRMAPMELRTMLSTSCCSGLCILDWVLEVNKVAWNKFCAGRQAFFFPPPTSNNLLRLQHFPFTTTTTTTPQ